MTRKECELALVELMEKAQAIAESFDEKINHLSIWQVQGHIVVNGHEWDYAKGDYIRKNLLNATQFSDGEFRSWDGGTNG